LKYPGHPEAYELRLIDDDENFYVPFYEMAPLERKD
jgi:glycine betaine/choline ABC-type transport system substrate-binding protein